jgi:selenocysteine lyase/cysteine desulfurase
MGATQRADPARTPSTDPELNMHLDTDFVREHFPPLTRSDTPVFCASAGGTFMARQAADRFDHFNRQLRVQPYSAFSPSREGGEAMDLAKAGWAEALNVPGDTLTFGPSTSLNSYVMAQALAPTWGPGDEIVVTQQDHEANQGAWRRAAERAGATLREWPVDPSTGLLDTDDLVALLGERTRWVFFPHCSNIAGTVNPVQDIVRRVRERCDARVCVDAVAYAPHHVCDLRALDVDMYLFSLYKVFGPHQGLLYVRAEAGDELPAQSHYFLAAERSKRFNPTGPQHAEVAASYGVLEYFDAVIEHHGMGAAEPRSARLQALHPLFAEHEAGLAAVILSALSPADNVRVLGKPHCDDGDRVATIAFECLDRPAGDVAAGLRALGIGAESGDFYARRLLEATRIDPDTGVVRLSLVHYNTVDEAQRVAAALSEVLGNAPR